ncbi:protein-tyrosine phosphatase Pyp3 [Schizosaccharomyces cryophilus OY26]|uniref:Protein-tyrosine phosphatase Pyp3 n=1 Tax=Schizosaccharomyces cryophilus (strain OY26 / ATCC MYA-4695 / CBS 11777 / NBRC 106824 / NRRL Y48691) TaxID=653667 RepID=S9VQC7_SCHCR|nr:protein-tyrosine phosphatase Pyp3 [Schizosaccharomyces cryophilus OY26]EPY50168.1 protein-tyrosine phosphatase Pyp3 [Schizosaccharomyces cryophilus OY26]
MGTMKNIPTALLNINERADSILEQLNKEEALQIYKRMPEFNRESSLRNRYSNIFPYKDNYVHLSPKWGYTCDYMNASNVILPCRQSFIATQGPTLKTIPHFWKMVWQSVNDHGIIVMLTKLQEGLRTKCDLYWPSETEKSLQVDGLKVTYSGKYKVESVDDCTVRKFVLEKGLKKKTVYHFYYTEWSDFKSPKATSIFSLLLCVKSLAHTVKFHKSPIVVHCSAGCGRTGTFMALLELVNRIEFEYSRNYLLESIPEIVYCLRMQRMQSVQSAEQLIFLYTICYELLQMPFPKVPKLVPLDSTYSS